MTVFRSPAAAHCPSNNGAPDVARLLQDGRKAKRALRRRMKPKQQRCNERMLGPVIEKPCRELPKLPRGGDGRALVSLRPSLGPRVSTEVADPALARRPATASSVQNQVDSLYAEESMYMEGHRRVQSSPTPPVPVGSWEAGMGDDTDQQQLEVPCTQTRERQRPLLPLRPVGDKERARQSYTKAGQRTIRRRDRSASSDEETDGHTWKAEPQATGLEQDKIESAVVPGNDNEFGHLHMPRQHTIDGDDDACNQFMGGQDAERNATLVLSSTVLLSPKGRARTPTISTAPADGSYFPGGLENWASTLSPRPQTPLETINLDQPARYSEAPASSFDIAEDPLRTPLDVGIRHHVTSRVSGAVGVS